MITIKTKYSNDNKSNVAYLNYIATREGVSIELSKEHLNKPVSQKQKDLLAQLFKDDAFTDDLKELKAFRNNPSSYTASQLISRGLDYTLNVDNEVYLNYIATRDGAVVEPTTQHGLFDLKGIADLSNFKSVMSNSDSRVYKMIISLPYNSEFRERDKWETLIRSSHTELAKAFKSNVADIAWVGAVHEASNPHVHLMIWSKTDKELWLNNTEFKKSMESLKVTYAQKIYKDEFTHLNAQRHDVMQSLRKDVSQHLKHFNHEILRDGLHPETLRLIQEYAPDIPDVKYGYQSQENKAKINSILVSLIENHSDLQKMFETLVDNHSKRLDIYNVAKEENKQDHINEYIDKVFYPTKNDKPILQNTLIEELQNLNLDEIKKSVVEPTTQSQKQLTPDMTEDEMMSQLVALIKEKRQEHYGDKYEDIFVKEKVLTHDVVEPTTHYQNAMSLDEIKNETLDIRQNQAKTIVIESYSQEEIDEVMGVNNNRENNFDKTENENQEKIENYLNNFDFDNPSTKTEYLVQKSLLNQETKDKLVFYSPESRRLVEFRKDDVSYVQDGKVMKLIVKDDASITLPNKSQMYGDYLETKDLHKHFMKFSDYKQMYGVSNNNVVEPTTQSHNQSNQTLGLKLGKGMMRSMMQVSNEIEMTHQQAFIQSKKHQNENRRNHLSHRQIMED